MKITVVAFATASDVLGQDALEITLPDGSAIEDLRRVLVHSHPDLERIWERLAVAIDSELVQGEHALTDGVEVALLPPVSGGCGQ
jgi:molybdopterin converting factor subunit 1